MPIATGAVEQIIVREPGAAPVATAAVVRSDPASALITEGKAAFANCSACHAIEQGAPNGAGPNLAGIVGNAAGAVAGFAYSDALKSSGITWTAAELDSYIANPTRENSGHDDGRRGDCGSGKKTGGHRLSRKHCHQLSAH